MGLSGTSGPFTGAYQTWNVSVATAPAATNSHMMWSYLVATGMEVTVYQVQAFANHGGNGATVDVFDDGSTLLTAAIPLATNSHSIGALATPLGVVIAAGSTITATLFNGINRHAADITLSILWAPTGNTHPSSVRSAFE